MKMNGLDCKAEVSLRLYDRTSPSALKSKAEIEGLVPLKGNSLVAVHK